MFLGISEFVNPFANSAPEISTNDARICKFRPGSEGKRDERRRGAKVEGGGGMLRGERGGKGLGAGGELQGFGRGV